MNEVDEKLLEQGMYVEKGAIENCKIQDCKSNKFLVKIHSEHFENIILNFLDAEKDKEKIEIVKKMRNQKIYESNFEWCENHLNERYNFIIDIFNKFENKEDDKKSEIKEDLSSIRMQFSKMPFKNITDFFKFKVNDIFCNKVYSGLFKGEDNLRKSIIKSIKKHMNKTEDELFSYMHQESEFIWFLQKDHYSSIPIYWQKNLRLEKYIGKTESQGQFNGPDFILKDDLKQKTYGFEIVELNKTVFHSPKGYRDIEKVIRNRVKQIEKRGGSLINYSETITKEINLKVEKWKKYKNTDYKFVGMVLNHSVPDEWYLIFDMFFNSTYVSAGLLDGIFFM